jgi:L-fucose isomerase-like protein
MIAKPYGVLALARPTFDVPYAEAMAAKAFDALDAAEIGTIGPRGLLFDADAARKAAADLKTQDLAGLLLLQVTFTDASMTLELAREIDAPLAIWAFPEPRLGGRLRLNSFCGLNLAAHALGRAGIVHQSIYAAPDGASARDKLIACFVARHDVPALARNPVAVSANDEAKADAAAAAMMNARIGLIGEHPAGFDTCRYEARDLEALTGVSVRRHELKELFSLAASMPPDVIAARRRRVAGLKGIGDVDQTQLDKSLSLFDAMNRLKADGGLAAFAVRCWPETFTEFGCAICGPMGMMNGEGVPAACEADVYGAVTSMMLNAVAGEPSWLVDIVDMDIVDQTAVFWHCGSAPEQMRDPEYAAEAQIHSNRKMPLLFQFPLKPGRITIARLTQARNETKLVVTGGDVMRAPISFTGTSGVVRFDAPMQDALEDLIGLGLEHHVAMVYGDHRGAMTALGRKLGLEVVGLGH